jgi:hypothetical protein
MPHLLQGKLGNAHMGCNRRGTTWQMVGDYEKLVTSILSMVVKIDEATEM